MEFYELWFLLNKVVSNLFFLVDGVSLTKGALTNRRGGYNDPPSIRQY